MVADLLQRTTANLAVNDANNQKAFNTAAFKGLSSLPVLAEP